MHLQWLKFFLKALGVTAIGIGGSISIFGPHAVASFFNFFIDPIFNAGPISEFKSPNVDSEFRFYGIMFAFYGWILIQTSSRIRHYYNRIPLLLLIFFAAGCARLLSLIFVGVPHPLFIILMVVELPLPVLLYRGWRKNDVIIDYSKKPH